MKGTHLGEFEELVLLIVGVLADGAYAVSIVAEIEKQTGRSVSLSPVHSALYRLEEKGFAKSELKGATNSRGGRRKRMYELTAAGKAALGQVRMMRNNLWNLIPGV